MSHIFHLFLYDPLLNALVFLYNTIAFEDLGVAIILTTLLIRVILYPVFHKSAKYQAAMQDLQPKLKKVQEIHGGDMEKQSQAMMALYKEHNVNPFSGIGFLLVQLPILIALYQIFIHLFDQNVFSSLYGFITPPESLNTSFLGLINLRNRSILMVGLAAVFQYIQARVSLPKKEKGEETTSAELTARRMAFIGPVITIAVLYNFPAAIGLYWTVGSLFSIIQQIAINRQLNHEKLERIRNRTGAKDGV